MNDEQRMSVSDYFGAKTSPAPQSQITEGGGANEGRSPPSAGANNGDNGGGAGDLQTGLIVSRWQWNKQTTTPLMLCPMHRNIECLILY